MHLEALSIVRCQDTEKLTATAEGANCVEPSCLTQLYRARPVTSPCLCFVLWLTGFLYQLLTHIPPPGASCAGMPPSIAEWLDAQRMTVTDFKADAPSEYVHFQGVPMGGSSLIPVVLTKLKIFQEHLLGTVLGTEQI